MKIVLKTAVVLALVVVGASCREKETPPPSKAGTTESAAEAPAQKIIRLPDGAVAPDFTLQALDGKAVSLSDHKGKPTILEFWAAWCPPCQRAFPLVDKLNQEFADKPVAIISVCTSTKQADLEAFLKQNPNHSLTILFDPAPQSESVGFARYLIDGFPSFFVIGADGKIVTSFKGFTSEHNQNTLRQLVEQQLAASR